MVVAVSSVVVHAHPIDDDLPRLNLKGLAKEILGCTDALQPVTFDPNFDGPSLIIPARNNRTDSLYWNAPVRMSGTSVDPSQVDVPKIEDILPIGLEPKVRKILVKNKDSFQISHHPFADHQLYINARMRWHLPNEVPKDQTLLFVRQNFRFRMTLTHVGIELADYDTDLGGDTRPNRAFLVVSDHKEEFPYVEFQPTRVNFDIQYFPRFLDTLKRLGYHLQ